MEQIFLVQIFESIPTIAILMPIFICSVLLLAVFIERMFFFTRIKNDYRPISSEVASGIRENRFRETKDYLSRFDGPLAEMLQSIAENWHSYGNKKHMLSFYAGRAMASVEKYAVVISTIATISPMLGLLGTVTGMMKSFGSLSGAEESAHKMLAYGITEALITTILGLIVAIPAVVFYNYMVSKASFYSTEIEHIINTLESAAEESLPGESS